MSLFSAQKSPEVLIESWSPVCDIQAFAEESQSCVYFYLWINPGKENPQVRGCWVCNTRPAPEALDKAAMDRGEAPMMPAGQCRHDLGGIRLRREELSIVWLEEGDAAALLEGDRILALIPGWAGQGGCHGYARYAAGTGSLAWELAQAEAALAPRVARSRAYWERMAGESGGYWPELQEKGLGAMEEFFGPHEKYYAIDGGQFPAKALVTGRRAGRRYAFTLGVSALCQPAVEQFWQDQASQHRRIELGFAAGEDLPEEAWMGMLNWLSAQSGLPWRYLSWLGHGHTIPCNRLPGFEAVLFLDPRELAGIEGPELPPVMGEPVSLLWAVPLTPEEYYFARTAESSTALLSRCRGRAEELPVFTGEGKFLLG